jgi:hypothetical protein
MKERKPARVCREGVERTSPVPEQLVKRLEA